MTSDVVLTAALRNNLLSLQKTQSFIDITQFRLATGRKVNSALDNPQSFFAAEALNNRASDLQRLLDGLGQNIQVIKAADNGITALTKLVEQADSVATQARDALSQGTSEAKVIGDRDLSGITDITSLTGVTNLDTIVVTVTDPDDPSTPVALKNAGVVTLSTNDSIEEVVTQINDLNQGITGDAVIEAKLNSDGFLEIRSLNGGSLRLDFVTAAVPTDDAANLALSDSLGFGQVARVDGDGTGGGTNNVAVTASARAVLTSFELYQDATQTNRAVKSDQLYDNLAGAGLFDDAGNQLFDNLDDTADDFTIAVNGGTAINIGLFDGTTGLTIQGFIDAINSNASLNELIEAGFDEDTSQITIRALDSSVTDITIGAVGDLDNEAANFGFGAVDFDTAAMGSTTTNPLQETIRFAAAAGILANAEKEYNNIRTQIDALVSDTGYRGVNLLNGDTLVSVFNEFRTSTLTTTGQTFTSTGLGLDEANFANATTVDSALDQVRDALESVRGFGTTLANNLSIIQTREEFTKELINTLTEGSDKLTIADQNEEGAKLLSLQTRQQLGVTSLSLASQSQQSILRLF